MRDAFLIISVVDFPNLPLSYSSVRSTFTPEERMEQTKESILSIKKFCPDASIYLIEAGTKDRAADFSTENVNYTYCGNEPKIKRAISSKFKALGERAAMMRGLQEIRKNAEIGTIFKLSGRYLLNGHFSRTKWNDEKFNFKITSGVYSTRLYSLPEKRINELMLVLWAGRPFAWLGRSYEQILKILISPRSVNLIDRLGVSGKVAVDGDIIEE